MESARRTVTLRDRLSWPSTLAKAYFEVVSGANPDSKGSDGVTIEQFRNNARSYLSQLQRDIKTDRYKHGLGRAVAIPKNPSLPAAKGNVRPITVFTIRDRIVQRAISNIIWPHVRDRIHSEVSYGGIRKYATAHGKHSTSSSVTKNVESAAMRILTLRASGFSYVFETDIQSFYPSINKQTLVTALSALLPDASLSDLVEAAIETAVINADAIEARGLSEYWDPRLGVPQGGVLSPMLANLYLASFDDAMTADRFKMVRYVDDLVVLAKSEDEANRAHLRCRQLLSGLGLSIHGMNEPNNKGKIKTRIISGFGPFEFLGIRFHKRTIVPASDKLADLDDRMRELAHVRFGSRTLVELITRLNRLNQGWVSAYSFCDIPQSTIEQIDHKARTRLAEWMLANKLIRNINTIDKQKQATLGLWSATQAEISPVSKRISASK